MKFVFRLERLFRFREQVERQRAQTLAHAVRAEQEHQDAVRAAEAHLARLSDQSSESGEIATAGALYNLGLTVRAAAARLEGAVDSHRSAADRVHAEQTQFGEARRDRRVLERLREQRHEDFALERSRDEQRAVDAQAGTRREPDGESR